MKSGEIFCVYYRNSVCEQLCYNTVRRLVCIVTIILVRWVKVISLAGCRKCKRPSHIPQRCEELESKEIKIRTYIEDRMTDALVR